MNGMGMGHDSWSDGLAVYLGMWMATMVPMMLPSLVPALAGYRRTVRGSQGMWLHGLTAMVGIGYFVVWAILGTVIFLAAAALAVAGQHWGAGSWPLPLASGAGLLAAGTVQLSAWKARQLAACRKASGCGSPRTPQAVDAWLHGLRLGVQCALCCSGLMMALLSVGMMNLVAMVLVTLAVTTERLAAAPQRVARLAGLAMVAIGVLSVARM